MIRRGNGKREVIFDPEARREHLRGFSERKRQRRAFGLAMQKVKDRKLKIEQRASMKKSELERVEEAERQKEELMESVFRINHHHTGADTNILENNQNNDSATDDDCVQGIENKEEIDIDTKVYDDRKTENHWGGQVTVTTSAFELGDFINDDDDDDDDDDNFNDEINNIHNDEECNSVSDKRRNNNNNRTKNKNKSVDTAQQYAGNVQKYLNELKGNMPSKKSDNITTNNTKRKGRDGASDMKGVGGSGNFKIASKLLSKSKTKDSSAFADNNNKNKRRKKNRKR